MNLMNIDNNFFLQIAIRHHQWKLIWGQTKEFRPHKKQVLTLSCLARILLRFFVKIEFTFLSNPTKFR